MWDECREKAKDAVGDVDDADEEEVDVEDYGEEDYFEENNLLRELEATTLVKDPADSVPKVKSLPPENDQFIQHNTSYNF